MRTGLTGSILAKLVLGVVTVSLFRQAVWTPVIITGRSMLPTLRSGRLAGVNKLAYRFDAPRRGDVVAVWTGRELIVKRIVGLPGEEISAREGILYVNGARLAEPYVQLPHGWAIGAAKIEADSFVIAGDNRTETLVAVVHRSRIMGRLIF